MRFIALLLLALLAAVSVFAEEGAPIKATADPLTDDPALYMETFTPANDPTLQPGQRKVIVAGAPIWYADPATHELNRARIDLQANTDPVDGESSYVETRNTIQYRTNAAGVSTVRRGPYILRTRFAQVRIEDTNSTAMRKQDATLRPSALVKVDGQRIRTDGVLPTISYTSEVGYGRVKENIILNAVPDPSLLNSEAVLLVFQFDTSRGATITPGLVNGELLWSNNGGTIVLRQPEPFVYDANRTIIPSRYVLRANAFAIAMPARALRDAAYPVTVDPTYTTNGSECTAARTTYDTDMTDEYVFSWIKFTLPDLTGYTVTAATATFVPFATAAPPSFNIYSKCDVTGAWDITSSLATLEALSFNALTDTQSCDGTSTMVFNVFGGATKGISKIYTDDSSPSPCTVKLYNDGDSATDAVVTSIQQGASGDTLTTFWPYDSVVYPYLTITYVDPSTIVSGRKAGGVGVIQ